MNLETGKYYHIYNRSNNREIVFREHSNYILFLKKYRSYLRSDLPSLAYCLMPTHFHFLVKVKSKNTNKIKKYIGILQSSYTKSINNSNGRTGSLFQQHTKSKVIDDESYLITVAAYIHQNPVRAGLIDVIDNWPYSSYPDLAKLRNGTLPSQKLINDFHYDTNDFIKFTNKTIPNIQQKYWV